MKRGYYANSCWRASPAVRSEDPSCSTRANGGAIADLVQLRKNNQTSVSIRSARDLTQLELLVHDQDASVDRSRVSYPDQVRRQEPSSDAIDARRRDDRRGDSD